MPSRSPANPGLDRTHPAAGLYLPSPIEGGRVGSPTGKRSTGQFPAVNPPTTPASPQPGLGQRRRSSLDRTATSARKSVRMKFDKQDAKNQLDSLTGSIRNMSAMTRNASMRRAGTSASASVKSPAGADATGKHSFSDSVARLAASAACLSDADTVPALDGSVVLGKSCVPEIEDLPDDVRALKVLCRERSLELTRAVALAKTLYREAADQAKTIRDLEEECQLHISQQKLTSKSDIEHKNCQLVLELRRAKAEVNELRSQIQLKEEELQEEKEILNREVEQLKEKEEQLREDMNFMEEQTNAAYTAADKAKASTDFEQLARVLCEFSERGMRLIYFQSLRKWRDDNKKRRFAFRILTQNSRQHFQWEDEMRTEAWRRIRQWAKERRQMKHIGRIYFQVKEMQDRCTLQTYWGLFIASEMSKRAAVMSRAWGQCEARAKEERRASAATAQQTEEFLKQVQRGHEAERTALDDGWRSELENARARGQEQEQRWTARKEQWELARQEGLQQQQRAHAAELGSLREGQSAERQKAQQWEREERERHAGELSALREEHTEEFKSRATEAMQEAAKDAAQRRARDEEVTESAAAERAISAADKQRLESEVAALRQEVAERRAHHANAMRGAEDWQDARRRRDIRDCLQRASVERAELTARWGIVEMRDNTLSAGALAQWRAAAEEWRRGHQREAAAEVERKRVATAADDELRAEKKERQLNDERAERERSRASDAKCAAMIALREGDALKVEQRHLSRQVGRLALQADEATRQAKELSVEAVTARHALQLLHQSAKDRRSGDESNVCALIHRALDIAEELRFAATETEQHIRSPERHDRLCNPNSPAREDRGKPVLWSSPVGGQSPGDELRADAAAADGASSPAADGTSPRSGVARRASVAHSTHSSTVHLYDGGARRDTMTGMQTLVSGGTGSLSPPDGSEFGDHQSLLLARQLTQATLEGGHMGGYPEDSEGNRRTWGRETGLSGGLETGRQGNMSWTTSQPLRSPSNAPKSPSRGRRQASVMHGGDTTESLSLSRTATVTMRDQHQKVSGEGRGGSPSLQQPGMLRTNTDVFQQMPSTEMGSMGLSFGIGVPLANTTGLGGTYTGVSGLAALPRAVSFRDGDAGQHQQGLDAAHRGMSARSMLPARERAGSMRSRSPSMKSGHAVSWRQHPRPHSPQQPQQSQSPPPQHSPEGEAHQDPDTMGTPRGTRRDTLRSLVPPLTLQPLHPIPVGGTGSRRPSFPSSQVGGSQFGARSGKSPPESPAKPNPDTATLSYGTSIVSK